MPWMTYAKWSGSVAGRRLRVPERILTVRAFGLSQTPLSLRSGATGRILNVLHENARAPNYVRFRTARLNFTHAVELRIERGENSDVVWRDLWKVQMPEDAVEVVILYADACGMEIEYAT